MTKFNPTDHTDIKFRVCFVSPHFVVYIKCAGTKHWQLVRQQGEPVVKEDGSAKVTLNPVLLFNSVGQAREFVRTTLGVETEAKPGWFARLFPVGSGGEFETFETAGERVTVSVTLDFPAVVYQQPSASRAPTPAGEVAVMPTRTARTAGPGRLT